MSKESTASEIPEENLIDHLVQSKISDSGNSSVNVDIKIEIDVKPIAFAIIYSLFATKQITEPQLEEAMKKLDEF